MSKPNLKPNFPTAQTLDEQDPLRRFRERFHFPQVEGRDALYFTGNSLGLMPKKAREYVEQELVEWEVFGVEGHFHAKNPWLAYHELLTEPMARIVGAMPSETVVMNALTINLHLMLVSFYRPTSERFKIIIEKGAFPSDQYAIESQIKFHGLDVDGSLIELAPRDGESTLRTEDIVETIEREGDTVALVMLGGVNYYTGQAFDMAAITAAGHAKGAIVGFDLAHAAGNLELRLHDWDVDFAVWCSYKYLNGGPGAVAGAFVHERYSTSFDLPRFAGWWGNKKETRFLMRPDFEPLTGADGWQLSNSPILLLAALRASLEIFDEAGMSELRKKSVKLTAYLEYLLDEFDDTRVTVITPRDASARGCQLSIRVQKADKSLFEAISNRGGVADWREPDVIRVAPVPLYNSFSDVYQFSALLKACLS